jgi:single-strand DNA-binding protein
VHLGLILGHISSTDGSLSDFSTGCVAELVSCRCSTGVLSLEVIAVIDESSCERNEVALVGRLSDIPEERVLPSGDVVWTFRLVVPRPECARRNSRTTVDVVPCAVWGGRVRASVRTWRAGDVVEVEGALRRRFFKAAGSAASVMEIEVASGRMVRRAAIA